MKPSYLGIGAMKCATTSLHVYLRCHPMINEVDSKELHWFDTTRKFKSKQEYEENFNGRVTGEITPEYQFFLEDIKELYPDVKLILCVRNPIDRIISEFRHIACLEQEVAQMEDHNIVFQKTNETISGAIEKHKEGQFVKSIERGFYDKTIKSIEDLNLQLLVLDYDSLIQNQDQVWKTVCDFLEVDFHHVDINIKANTSEHRPPLAITDVERSYLETIYKDTYHYMDRFGIKW